LRTTDEKAVGPDEVFRRFPREGAIGALAETIERCTGTPAPPDAGALRAALAAAFPDLPEPDAIEGCTDHPALTLRLRVPGLGREAVKLVLLPRGDVLEARVRAELPGGAYRKETLLKVLGEVEEVERALGGREGRSSP
jgi:hypothetical protein